MTAFEPWRAAACVLLLALVSLSAACEESPETQAAAAPAAPDAAPAARIAGRERLARQDKIAPEIWLASRQAGHDLLPDDASVEAMHALLRTAQERFGDTTRMIANRAVQLEDMLKAKGIEEPAPEIIKAFSRVAERGTPLDGFGAMCQSYFILRQQGMTREQAFAHLASALAAPKPAASVQSDNLAR